jgi:glycerophosphoryl diester phosphodiesterase
MPENTIPAFLRAMELGCDWIEMDVVVTGDGHVLISHEPWMDARVCRKPDGTGLSEEEGRGINIFDLSLAEVQAYFCVPSTMDVAPTLWKDDWHKPTLREVVHATDRFSQERGSPPVKFNIEIKSGPDLYGTYQPLPVPFAERVLAEVQALHIAERCLVQCFDVAVLAAVHATAPEMPVAMLVENTQELDVNLQRLGFLPNYYSPEFHMVNEDLVRALCEKGLGLLAWTVNGPEDIRRMIMLGVDGIITDHPERVVDLK